MRLSQLHLAQKVEDCRRLYFKHGGRRHEQIERDMRALGWEGFSRRILYTRNQRGRREPGWIEVYRWKDQLRNGTPRRNAGIPAGPAVPAPGPTKRHRHRAGKDAGVPAGFLAWLKQVSPLMNWTWRHQRIIIRALERITLGISKRLMIFVPPRHGKSELVTVRYAAWRIKEDPSMNVIIGSYNQRLANRFSRKIRRILSEPPASAGGQFVESDIAGNAAAPPPAKAGSGEINSQPKGHALKSVAIQKNGTISRAGEPETLHPQLRIPHSSDFPFANRPINTVAEWETAKGGGLRAVGVGSGVTGFGANLIIIDDPVKSRSEAESKTFRDRLYEWFTDDIYTRLEPGGAVIIIQTRWHEDDLAGRLLTEMTDENGEKWDVVNLPALSEPPALAGGQFGEQPASVHNAISTETKEKGPITDEQRMTAPTNWPPAHAGGSDPEDDRLPGEALCPERYDEHELERIKRRLGTYAFSALYQQRPVPAEGGFFKRDWFRTIARAPEGLNWVRGYDLAATAGALSDHTASFRVAYDREGNMYIDGGVRRRIEYPEQRRLIQRLIAAEPNVRHVIEATANARALVQDLRRDPATRGRHIRCVEVREPKTARALRWNALAEEGRVFLIRGPWNDEFIDEAASFPLGAHDDQIDAVSLAVMMLEQKKKGFYAF